MIRSPDPGPQNLATGDVVWVILDPTRGREQGGHRPAVVVATNDYLAAVTTMAIVVPVTGRDRSWPNHIRLTGPTELESDSWAMTEQIRTVSRDRITAVAGRVDVACNAAIHQYLSDFLDL